MDGSQEALSGLSQIISWGATWEHNITGTIRSRNKDATRSKARKLFDWGEFADGKGPVGAPLNQLPNRMDTKFHI